MKEAEIEAKHGRKTRRAGGYEYKFVSPGRRGVPDRIKLMPVPEEHREIVAEYVRFIEYKAPGKKPSLHQVREHKRLQKLGFIVEVID
jgi:hypothetical protein